MGKLNDRQADAILALINSKPSTPTREEIVQAMVGAVREMYGEMEQGKYKPWEQVTAPAQVVGLLDYTMDDANYERFGGVSLRCDGTETLMTIGEGKLEFTCEGINVRGKLLMDAYNAERSSRRSLIDIMVERMTKRGFRHLDTKYGYNTDETTLCFYDPKTGANFSLPVSGLEEMQNSGSAAQMEAYADARCGLATDALGGATAEKDQD